MKIELGQVQGLLENLAKKTGVPLDYPGLKEMSSLVGLADRYLYELSRKVESEKEKGNATINVQASRLELVARYLGYESFRSFLTVENTPLDKVLVGLVGNYYSFVRGNRTETAIIQSPVRITHREKGVWFELKGPMRRYEGHVELTHGCLFILMKEPEGKQFQHVYKIGTREKPLLLQGIFSGVSTVFEPIGGRTVLIRSEERWEAMKGHEWRPSAWKKIMPAGGKELVNFFSKFEDNNLSIHKVSTFSIKDLTKHKNK